jgi:hypothetical protein
VVTSLRHSKAATKVKTPACSGMLLYASRTGRRLQTQMNDMSSTKHCAPFFIAGSGRSGTTLLRLILAGHSRIVIPPETWFILDLVDQFPLTSPLTPEQVRAAIHVITECHRWPDMNMSANDFADQALALGRPTLADLINIVFRFHLERSGKPRIGDKTPPYITILPQLKAIYPGAKFIHLVRDGRDVAISFVDAHFKYRPYHGDAFEWTKAVRNGMSYRSSPFAHDIFEVRYEDLVGQPERTVHAICEFLGEAFEPSMMAFNTRLDLVPKRERGIHQKLGKPISADAIEVWRSKLSALECFVIEASLRKDLETLDYPLRFSAPVWRPFLYVTRQLTQALAPLLDYVVPALRRRGIMSRHGYI